MEQFSLEKYLANPSRKLVTRDGRNARIICTDRKDLNFPIIALIETRPGGGEVTYSYTKGGRHCTACADFDLFFAPEKHEGWINLFKGTFANANAYLGESCIYSSKEIAEREGRSYSNYLSTIKIEWEE